MRSRIRPFFSLDFELPEALRDESTRVALLNFRMCELLLISFEAMIKGEDLREKILASGSNEKKIDDIKLILLKDAEQVPVASFWEGKKLSDLLTGLTMISDFIEDASGSSSNHQFSTGNPALPPMPMNPSRLRATDPLEECRRNMWKSPERRFPGAGALEPMTLRTSLGRVCHRLVKYRTAIWLTAVFLMIGAVLEVPSAWR